MLLKIPKHKGNAFLRITKGFGVFFTEKLQINQLNLTSYVIGMAFLYITKADLDFSYSHTLVPDKNIAFATPKAFPVLTPPRFILGVRMMKHFPELCKSSPIKEKGNSYRVILVSLVIPPDKSGG